VGASVSASPAVERGWSNGHDRHPLTAGFAETDAPTWLLEPAGTIQPQSPPRSPRAQRKTAGENRLHQTLVDGNELFAATASPIRFWAVGDGAWSKRPNTSPISPATPLAGQSAAINYGPRSTAAGPHAGKITDVNREELDGLWRTVAAMKKEGIYTSSAPTGPRPPRSPPHGPLDSQGDSRACSSR